MVRLSNKKIHKSTIFEKSFNPDYHSVKMLVCVLKVGRNTMASVYNRSQFPEDLKIAQIFNLPNWFLFRFRSLKKGHYFKCVCTEQYLNSRNQNKKLVF